MTPDISIGEKDRLEVVLDFLARTKLIWGTALIVGLIAFLAGYISIPFLPSGTWIKVAIVAIAVASLTGGPLAWRLAKSTVAIEKVLIIEVDATEQVPVRLHLASRDALDRITVEDVQPYRYQHNGFQAWMVRSFEQIPEDDRDEYPAHITHRATGPWMSSVSDPVMLAEREKIEKHRLEQSTYAQLGIKLATGLDTIRDEVEAEVWEQIHGRIAGHLSLGDGDIVQETIGQVEDRLEDETSNDDQLRETLEQARQELGLQDKTTASSGGEGEG